MKKTARIAGFASAALFAAGFALTAHANVPKVEVVPGEFIVKLKPQVDLKSLKTLSLSMGSEAARVVSPDSNTILVKRNLLEKSDFSIKSIKGHDSVEYVEPNYIYKALKTPNDPLLPQLWGLINNGSGTKSAGIDIGAEAAWNIQTGSRDVVVAVIDTGVDFGIADLAPNAWINEAELNGEEGVDDDGNGFVDDVNGYDFVNNDGDPTDDHGHGSHCSGTIGAKGDDGEGVVGVAWDVRIMGVKFLSASGSGSLENAIKSIDYARINGAHIMSNSWGGGPESAALKEAIQRANDAGILFVAAAGNHSANNDETDTFPANYDVPNVVSVAAIGRSGRLASFSCYGKTKVHVAAPGVEILSTTPDGFKSWQGTSMATPHVSGVAALLLSNEPNLSVTEIKERLISTAKPVSLLRNKVASNGLVNAYHALTNTQAPIDQMDPYYWPTEERSISTAHPYKDGTSETYEVKVEGAEFVAVHFSRFETEGGYDKVKFKDAQGNLIDTWSGAANDSFSPAVPGDTLIIEFTSDSSVSKYGFDIDAVAFRRADTE